MKAYKPEDVRVVGVFGHRGSGKTSLVEAFLFDSGATSRLGTVESGNLALEIDDIAREKQSTMAANVGFFEWDGCRVNVIDTPGDGNFWGATNRALQVVDSGLVTISAPDGVEPITQRVISDLGARQVPFAFVVTRLDKEGVDFDGLVAELKQELKSEVVPISLPLGVAGDFKGVVSLLSQKAYVAEGESCKEVAIPDEYATAVELAREELCDAVAAADDELAEKYLEEGTLAEDELGRGLRAAFKSGDVVPVLCAVPSADIGSRVVLDALKSFFPSPQERASVKGFASAEGQEEIELDPSPDGPLVAQVFRTYHDAFAGGLTYARIWSGKLVAGSDVYNVSNSGMERSSHMYFPLGGTKSGVEVKEATIGDLVVLTKLKSTKTGDVLATKDHPTFMPNFEEPEALLNFGLSAVVQKDEDKMGALVHKLTDEDPSLRYARDSESKETLLGGLGQAHIDYVIERLKKAGIETELHEPKVPYRETIRGTVMHVEGKHKKQTGGSGQFGVCFLNLEPQPRGEGFEFVDKIVGGAIPRQYIPSVEKGIADTLSRGPLSGNAVVDVKVTLYDGKYHRVDSSDMAFQAAGKKAMRAALADPKAKLILLEPYMHVDIQCPAESVGDVMGDLNSRRARVEDMTTEGRRGKISASVPMNEILRYTNVLKSITHGRGSYTMRFDRYEEAPPNVKEQVSASYVAADEHD